MTAKVLFKLAVQHQAAPNVRLPRTCHFCACRARGKSTTSPEIEPVRRSFLMRGSRTFTEVARLVPSGSSRRGGGRRAASFSQCSVRLARERAVPSVHIAGLSAPA